MAKKKVQTTVSTSEKRSIARRFNDLLAVNKAKAQAVDQRTGRKLERFRAELASGRTTGGRTLKAIEVALRVDALLASGALLTDLKKIAKPNFLAELDDEAMTELLREMHSIYQFCPDAYRFVGVKNETLLAAGVISVIPPRRGRRPKHLKSE